ncbi:hypothetical protein Tco_1468695, partial [Tanacetum coccineum]
VIFVVVDRFTKYAHFGTLPTNFNAHKVAEEAMWEWLSEFQEAYPSYNLEDKVAFEERRNVTPAVTFLMG